MVSVIQPVTIKEYWSDWRKNPTVWGFVHGIGYTILVGLFLRRKRRR